LATQNAYLHLIPAKPFSTAVMTGNLVAATIAIHRLPAYRGGETAAQAG
jgi:uncharacterized membrane protein YoaK (UPF0700 family)